MGASYRVRVYSVRGHYEDKTGGVYYGRVFLCDLRSDRVRLLGGRAGTTIGSEEGITPSVSVAGPYAGYVRSDFCTKADPCIDTVFVVNGVTGRSRHFETGAPVDELITRRDGLVAWIERNQLRLWRPGDAPVTLATSPALGNLAFAGSLLYWTQDGAAQSAMVK
jgi:hypothetical protein